MVDLKCFAEKLVRLETSEVQKLAKVLKEEYGIEAGAENVCIIENNKTQLSRQLRRKQEREAMKKRKC